MVEVMEVYVPADLCTDFYASFVPVISFRSDLCFSFSFMLHHFNVFLLQLCRDD